MIENAEENKARKQCLKEGMLLTKDVDAVLLVHKNQNVPVSVAGAVLSRTSTLVTRAAPSGRRSMWPRGFVRVRREPRRWRHDAGHTPRE